MEWALRNRDVDVRQDTDNTCHQPVTQALYGGGMNSLLRPLAGHPLRGVGSAVLWGVVELVALARSRWTTRRRHD